MNKPITATRRNEKPYQVQRHHRIRQTTSGCERSSCLPSIGTLFALSFDAPAPDNTLSVLNQRSRGEFLSVGFNLVARGIDTRLHSTWISSFWNRNRKRISDKHVEYRIL
ncbi:MAG TPA: hypothetical protein PKL10_15810 [Nitrospira sp.]|nr:hypothetical protein [Nitrospira sp.]HNN43763.1 hypothetical protein [Nitrospira sp.]